MSAHVIPDEEAAAAADGAAELDDGVAAGFEVLPHAATVSASRPNAIDAILWFILIPACRLGRRTAVLRASAVRMNCTQ